jgi:hypothetical protein
MSWLIGSLKHLSGHDKLTYGIGEMMISMVNLNTVKVRLSGTLGEWGVPIDRFCR